MNGGSCSGIYVVATPFEEPSVYRISAETTIRADIAAVWDAVTDVESWPRRDPHEQEARLDGLFVAGTTGWSKPRGGPATTWTITAVDPLRSWSSECRLPGGKLRGENLFEPLGDGMIRCMKTVFVTGPLVPLFRLHFGRSIRRDMLATWAALEQEGASRVAHPAGCTAPTPE
jgi:hypothetical protein